MADLQLFDFDQPAPKRHTFPVTELRRGGGGAQSPPLGGGDPSAPGTATRRAGEETSLTHPEEDEVRLMDVSEDEEEEEDIPELYFLSNDDLSSEGGSVDYGFITAVSCLVTGISLVAISYTIPRDVRVDPDSVSAREMERLERDKARVGAHLDRCVIAGLCLLTLGGVLLSTLLMISMWKGEMMRRKALALSKHRLYGSMSFRAGTSPTPTSRETRLTSEEDFEAQLVRTA